MAAQVAAEALSATEATLHSKLENLEADAATRRATLVQLRQRYDEVAAELAGAEANLSSAGALLGSAKAQLSLKESLLQEKDVLIADLKQCTSGGPGPAPRFWRSLGRLRRTSSGAAE